MRITEHVTKIVKVLLDAEGRYLSVVQIGATLGVPHQNLKTSLANLVKANVVLATETYPRLYTLNQPQALEFINLIEASNGALMRRAV